MTLFGECLITVKLKTQRRFYKYLMLLETYFGRTLVRLVTFVIGFSHQISEEYLF